MLINATLEDMEKYGNMAYDLALNPAKSCYPTYGDGIKTKNDFFDTALRGITKETWELLLFVMDGTVEGWIEYYWIPEDQYLQLCGCNIHRGTESALTELLDRLEKHFPGYTLYFGYPEENQEAIAFLQTHGFRCIEESWNYSFFFEGYSSLTNDPNVEKITRENFDKFRAVYHPDPETYWNCDRILEALDLWSIFIYNDTNTPVATLFLQGNNKYFEIYGTDFTDGIFQETIFRRLLTAALNASKHMGAKYMTYFCTEKEKYILSDLGFQCVGQYVLYTKTLTDK